jgi:hypothetical protein
MIVNALKRFHMRSVEPKKAAIINPTTGSRPIGKMTVKKNMSQSKIPVQSCEGACIRGEIARRTANIVSKNNSYRF